MGSCSSKPKTAEFEPVSDGQLEKPALSNFAFKNIDTETAEKISSERSLQTLLVENGHCDLLDALLQAEKVPVVDINLEQKKKNDKPTSESLAKIDQKEALIDGGKKCTSELLKERIVKSTDNTSALEKIILVNEVSVSVKDESENEKHDYLDANQENALSRVNGNADVVVNGSSANRTMTLSTTHNAKEFETTNNVKKHIKEASNLPEVTKETIGSKEAEKIIYPVKHDEASDKVQTNGGSISSKFMSVKDNPHPTTAASDIDDVWEKLASEFERQESLSSSRS